MQVRMCDTRVIIDIPNQQPVKIVPKSALLLRLLLLSDSPVSNDLAAHVLNIPVGQVAVHIRNLRGQLGDFEKTIVRTNDGDHRSVPRRPTTYECSMESDSQEFRRLVEQAVSLAGATWELPDDLSIETADEISQTLAGALALWNGSPATGFDHAGDRDVDVKKLREAHVVREQRRQLVEVYGDWQTLHADAVLLLADCMLRSDSGKVTSADVYQRVNELTRRPNPDDRVWHRLLLAATRAGDEKRLRDAWTRATAEFERLGEDVPPEVEELKPPNVTRIPGGGPVKPARRASRAHVEPLMSTGIVPASSSELNRIIELFGIAAPSSLELGAVGLRPIDCTKRAENGLDFAGVLAGKWVDTRETFDSFVAMLQRFQRRKPWGRARFLVIDPRSEAYDRLVQIRGGEVSPKSVVKLLQLASKFPCLEVRGISHLPAFRVLVIDDDIVTVSPYDLENQSAEASRLGWEAPHMLLDPLATFPLAPAFRIYFDGEWEAAHPIRLKAGPSGAVGRPS